MFILLLLGTTCALHCYLWFRLVRGTTAPRTAWRRLGTVLVSAGPALIAIVLIGGRNGLPFELVRILAWPAYLWLALVVYLTLALIAGEFVRPVLLRWLRRRDARRQVARRAPAAEPVTVGAAASGDTPAAAPAAPRPDGRDKSGPSDPSRRRFVARLVAGTATAVAAGTVGYGTYGVLRGPSVRRVTVPLAKLPRSAHGFRIALVSDIHLGAVLGRGFAEKVVATVNATQPDLIAVVGDLADGSVADLRSAAEPLAGLRARHGAYFVTGNHEYFSGAEEWTRYVQELGLRLLANERVELPAFDLAGVNDVTGEFYGDGPDFAAALGDRDPARASVLLAHQPIVIHEAVRHGVDLQLSGHTHGGQLWPVNHLAALVNPTVAGLDRYGDTYLYVTRGAGAWGPPTRVAAPSDVTVVELASTQA
ncbi:MAG: metallophosphoesterase [Actinomycetes bacterium]